jgi:hypothetical protein
MVADQDEGIIDGGRDASKKKAISISRREQAANLQIFAINNGNAVAKSMPGVLCAGRVGQN